jgi:hypothetical protein
MRRIMAALLGLRPDLALRERWWHRLVVVLFTLLCCCVAVVGTLIAYHPPEPSARNVHVIDTLAGYTKAHPELASSVPSFLNIGLIGKVADTGAIEPICFSVADAFCTANVEAHLDEAVAFLVADEPADVRERLKPADVDKWLQEEKSKGTHRVCFIKTDKHLPESSKIVAYSLTRTAHVRAIAHAIAVGGLFTFVLGVLLSMAYYRGVLYVVFGGRKPENVA